MSEAGTILYVEGLTKRFPGVLALDNVTFDLRRGEVHALCGENGAGKSTLIKTLSGLWPHGSYEGRLSVDGREACFSGTHDAEQAGIAVIYQELALIPEMTVAENIFLGSEPTRGGIIDWHQIYAQTRQLLIRYGLELDPAATVGDLGIGQQQLVEIVKALGKQSRILLLDEPTAALTESEVQILMRIVRDLKSHGITCIYISHKLEEVFAVSDRITVLRDGKSIATLDTRSTDRHRVIAHMVGREIKDFFPRRPTAPGAPILAVRDLTVTAPGRHRPVLQGITFTLRAGEVLGLGGLMGAGRTELLMHLFGSYGRRAAGSVILRGKPLVAGSARQAIESGLVLVSEDRKRYGLILEQSIGFNLSLATLDRLTRHGLIDASREIQRNQGLFGSLGIRAPGLEAMVNTLSGGNQQKVVLGKALMTEPDVIFLDEPTRGIDVGAKVDVYNLVNAFTDAGKAVVLVSSELPELMGMSDRMLILSEGRIGGEFERGAATQEQLLAAAMAYQGRAPIAGEAA